MKVTLTETASKDLSKLPIPIQARVNKIIERLSSWPSVSGAKALKGALAGQHRIRTGDYRVQFIAGKDEVIVTRIGHRDGFYEENMPRKFDSKSLSERYDAIFLSRWILGYSIRTKRTKRRMSVQELAVQVGVRPSLIDKIENGRTKVNVKLIDRIAKVLEAA